MSTDDRQRADALTRLGLREVAGAARLDADSLKTSVGGWFGVVQSTLPTPVFVITYALTNQKFEAAFAAAALVVFFIVFQLIRRKSVLQALAGSLVTAVAAFMVLRDGGHPLDFYVPGFYIDATYGSAFLISVLVRWPILGFLVGVVRGEPLRWRRNRKVLQRSALSTGLFAALFATRLLVQYPLYLAKDLNGIGIARVAMGYPPYILCIWLSWLLLRSSLTNAE